MADALKKLYIEPASMCNLKCDMCFRNTWFDEKLGLMSDAIIDNICKEIPLMDSIETVMLAGMGEPLIHKRTPEIVKTIAESGRKAEILTNATLLYAELSNTLVESGLNELWVSMDNSHTKQIEQTIYSNLNFFNKVRKDKCKLGFTFVVSDESINETDYINALADKFGADEINISRAIPSQKIHSFKIEQNIPLGNMHRLNSSQRYDKLLNYCPFVNEGKCFVKWDGSISPCMQLLHGSYTFLFDEQRKVYSYSFGNVTENSIRDIWNNQLYSDFRKRVKEFEFPDCTLCDGCDDRKKNIADCMYNTFPTCGACLWAQYIGRCL